MVVKKTDRVAQHNVATAFMDGSAVTIPTLSILQADGTLLAGTAIPAMDRALAEKIYSDMVYTRSLDERMVGAQRQGRLSFYLTCTGEEASVAGTAAAFSPDDMIMGQYREQAALPAQAQAGAGGCDHRLALHPAHRLSPLAKKSRSTVNWPILA